VPRRYVPLFLVSFVILFLELACIRWFGSTVVFLTFFTNLVLIASFVGMSVGCLAAARTPHFIRAVIPLTLVSVVLASGVLWAYERFGRVVIDVGGQASPQQIYFGTEGRLLRLLKDPSVFVVPIEIVAGVFFVLIAVIFVGLGQQMGRAFSGIPDRVTAYTVNVLGSLAGILVFAAASYLHTSPLVWFGIGLAICCYFIRPWTWMQAGALIGALVVVGLSAHHGGAGMRVLWSPYYKIGYQAEHGFILTNNLGHQGMIPVDRRGTGYTLPYLLNRDAGGPPLADVLIIGAGSGNDVQAALLHGARRVDAVEIDPVINAIGRADHPDRPFADPRVRVHLDDGRSFVRRTENTYDLVVYALVDSLVLHSGYSSLRLESYLFTEEAFRDVKARLKPDGVFALYNYYRHGWVVGRLETMATEVFGHRPLVISLPHREAIGAADQTGGITFLLVGNGRHTAVEAIRARFAERGAFWAHTEPRMNRPVDGFGAEPPAVDGTDPKDWSRIAPTRVDTAGVGRLPTDDWPFPYLREATIPRLNLRAMAIVAVASLAILLGFAPARSLRLDGRMFFLGAGFMLLETKGVVHMALLFGSTWVVNSIVFFAILVMILASNLYVLRVQPTRLGPYLVLLIASLLVNTLVPMSVFLALPGPWRVVASCAVIFGPIFFAGILFADAFRDSRRPDVDFGSNIAGVVVGALSENLSLVLGFNHLLIVAVAFYLLSALIGRRARLAPA
jgi:SAM-dependent methyltransferase